jgi:rhodanese-related sulfurtransferase
MSTTPNWNTISRRTILLVVLAVAAALIVNHLSPVGIPLMGQWNLAKGVVHANPDSAHLNDRLEIDNIEVAKLIYDGAQTLFVDARSEEDYEAGHVEGAISLSLRDFDASIEDFFNQYPPEQPIITYCSGRTCEDSHYLAQLLLDLGYERVNIMIDGFQIWKDKGFPVD